MNRWRRTGGHLHEVMRRIKEREKRTKEKERERGESHSALGFLLQAGPPVPTGPDNPRRLPFSPQ